MPTPDETTSLVPVARTLNWRQKCCKIFYWSRYFGIFLLLLVNVFRWILAVDTIISLFGVNPLANKLSDPQTITQVTLVEALAFNLVDTFICWIFLGVVVRSPRFVGCFTVFTSLICLPRFWTLVALFVLYMLGATLALQHFFPSALQNPDAITKVLFVLEFALEVLNVFTKVALVGVLNYVQVRNVARSLRYSRLLKGTLVVIWLSQMCTLISAMGTLYHAIRLVIANNNNSHKQQELSFAISVMDLCLLPIITRTAELIWTKILQDNKCIIGKDESNRFTRQNPRVSNTIETII